MHAVVFLISALVYVEADISLPPNIKQCYRNDPGLSNCIRQNMEDLKQIYPNGPIPELGIPSFYPAVNPKMVYNLFQFYDSLTNLNIWHLDNYTINSVEFGTTFFNVDFYYPSLGCDCQYTAKGTLLIVQFDSEGDITANMTSVPMKYKATLDTVTRNGTQYLTLKSSELELTVANYYIHYTNISKVPLLNDIANRVINMNQAVLLRQFTPFIEDIFKYVFDDIIRNLFKQYPVDLLLPEKK